MSGNNEKQDLKPESHKLACFHCGSTRYEYITYGYKADIVDVKQEEYIDEGWDASEGGDGWKCHNCGRRASDEARHYLETVQWYNW